AGEIQSLVREIDLLDVEGESVESGREALEVEGEGVDAVWRYVRAHGVAVAGAHGSGGLKDEGSVEKDGDGVVGQHAQGANVVQVGCAEVAGGSVDVVA